MNKTTAVILLAGLVVMVAVGLGVIYKKIVQVKQAPQAIQVTPAPSPTPTLVPVTNRQILLEVSEPADGELVTRKTIKVMGQTVPGAEVFVNDKETKANAKGDFSVSLQMDEGDNYILVMVVDSEGNVAEKELTVAFETFE